MRRLAVVLWVSLNAAWLAGLAHRAVKAGYRGCGMTNAVVEYPAEDNPARLVAQQNKHELRRRLAELARRMGARDPDALGDGLLLLIEGAYVSSHLFGPGGPARIVADAADALIGAYLTSNGLPASAT